MYRTELWLNEVKGKQLDTPICIPSYNRPKAPIFEKKSKLFPLFNPSWVFVFIRDTKEQYDLYKHLEDKVTLVPLPKSVTEPGMTRESILQWSQEKGYTNIFMFDDRLLNLHILHHHVTRTGKDTLGIAPYSDTYGALLLWEYLQNKYPTTISGISSKGHSWYPQYINREFTVNNPGYAWCYICLNVQDLKRYDIHYHSVETHGTDDCYMLYEIMKAGLPSRTFTDLAFAEVDTETVHRDNPNSGSLSSSPRPQRLMEWRTTFCKNVLHANIDDKVPGFRFRHFKDGTFTISFNFSSYWEEYYNKNKVK